MVQAGIGTGTEPADLATWLALASLAIFKMFNNWNNRTQFTRLVPAHSNPPRAPVSTTLDWRTSNHHSFWQNWKRLRIVTAA